MNRYELMYRLIPNATFSSLATFMYWIYPLSWAGGQLLPPIEKPPYITSIPLIVRSGSDSISSWPCHLFIGPMKWILLLMKHDILRTGQTLPNPQTPRLIYIKSHLWTTLHRNNLREALQLFGIQSKREGNTGFHVRGFCHVFHDGGGERVNRCPTLPCI